MGKHGQAIRARIKAFYERIKAGTRIKRVLERAKEITRKKTFFESVRTGVSCILALTVVFGYLQWRATIKDQSANRFLNIIDKLGNLHSESVRAGAVITMGAHLTENTENYEEYHGQSIPVLVIHLAKESSSTVRKEILKFLTSEHVKTEHVVGPLSSEMRELTLEIEKRSSSSLIETYITGEPNEILLDMSKLLVAMLEKMPPEKFDLSGFFLVDWSSKTTNWEQADFEKFRLVRGSLNRSNLKKANLRGAEFYQVDLTRACLQKADLGGASLKEVILKNAKLNDAILESTNLHSSDLREANLTDAHLAEATLVNADMEGATLEGADLFAADLEGAILDGADLERANLTNASLIDATLEEAILDRTYLQQANLTNAILKDATLKEALLEGAILDGTDLKRANFTNAILKKATLKEALLEGAILYGADLERADLTDANLKLVNLEKANLKGANLEGANLDRANLEGADLRAALLFGIDPNKFQSDLDRDTISKDLRQEFENNRIDLSQDTSISIEEEDRVWLINDKDYEQTYTVRKEERLKICTEAMIDPTELFSIDSNDTKKFQSDFDKGTISEDLRQEFKNNWIDLSENTAISVKEKGRIWLITDKDYEQTYTVRKEERLNIYKRTKFDPTDIKKAKNWQNAVFDDVKQKLSNQ